MAYKFLYSTREKFPTYRVDLTELFSNEIAKKGYIIHWHMQSKEPSDSSFTKLNEHEYVSVGGKNDGNSVLVKLRNHIKSLIHGYRLTKLVADNDFDFVQVRDQIITALLGLRAARKADVPFFYWMSFPYPEADIYRSGDTSINVSALFRVYFKIRGHITKYILYKLVLPKADYIFVQSDKMLMDVNKEGVLKDKMMPVPMGINISSVNNLQFESINDTRLKNKKVLVYLGTMVKVRRIDFLIEMLPLVLKHVPNCVLVLVGNAPLEDMKLLKQTVQDFGVEEHVIFTGFLPMEQGWSYVRESDVCLSPFRPSPMLDSTSPTKVVEYLAMRKPVVANKHPDQSKVLGESNAGFAVDYTIEDFASACIKLLKDEKLAKEMGNKGFEYVTSNRSYQVIAEKLHRKYEALLKDNK